jgi:hypothetical protein
MRRWLSITLVFLALVIASFLTSGYYLRWRAQSVLNDVSALVSAPNHDVAFAALKEKYGDRLRSVGCWSACRDHEVCSYEVTVSNRALSAVLRIPYTELNARFDLLDESIATAIVEYRSAQWKGESPVVHVQTDFCPAISRCGNFDFFYVDPWNLSSTSKRWNGSVEMGFSTAPELRKAALSLNVNCLRSIRGCTDIAQLLPSVWSPSATGVRCIVTNHEGQAR